MRIKHEFLGSSLVEIDVTFWRVIQGGHGHVDCFGDLDLILKDRFHQLAVVLQNRCLAGLEGMAFRPAQPKTNRERAGLGCLVNAAGIIGHVQTGYTD